MTMNEWLKRVMTEYGRCGTQPRVCLAAGGGLNAPQTPGPATQQTTGTVKKNLTDDEEEE